MSLLSLPNEVLFLIADSLEYSWNISALSQANHHLYSLLNCYAFQHNIRYFDRSVVKWAIDHDSEVVMSKMLDAGAFAHPRHNVAHILNVALKGRTKIVRLLLEKDLLSADDCETLINQATVYGQIPILQLLRERARLTFPGETVLLYGILSLNNRCVRIPPQSRYGSANSEYRRSRVGKDT